MDRTPLCYNPDDSRDSSVLTPILNMTNKHYSVFKSSSITIGVEDNKAANTDLMLRLLQIKEEKFLMHRILENAKETETTECLEGCEKRFMSARTALGWKSTDPALSNIEIHPFLYDGIILGLNKLGILLDSDYYKTEFPDGRVGVYVDYSSNSKFNTEGLFLYRK